MIVEESSAACLKVKLDGQLYSEAVIYKCFYWYGNDFDVTIVKLPDESFAVTLASKKLALSAEQSAALESRVRRDLIDFKTRAIVSEETRTIRELIVAKAFAHSDDFESPDPGHVDGSEGFDLAAYIRKSG
jgi:His-Xaa-Ser system protein HxsD